MFSLGAGAYTRNSGWLLTSSSDESSLKGPFSRWGWLRLGGSLLSSFFSTATSTVDLLDTFVVVVLIVRVFLLNAALLAHELLELAMLLSHPTLEQYYIFGIGRAKNMEAELSSGAQTQLAEKKATERCTIALTKHADLKSLPADIVGLEVSCLEPDQP